MTAGQMHERIERRWRLRSEDFYLGDGPAYGSEETIAAKRCNPPDSWLVLAGCPTPGFFERRRDSPYLARRLPLPGDANVTEYYCT